MRPLVLVLFCLLAAGSAWAQTDDLLISEYVEGSGNNKALEIFNGTEAAIDLGTCAIERYSNGSSTAVSIALDAVALEPGEVFIIANPDADAALGNLADQTSSDLNFNGDDALVLVRDGSVVDSLGQVGVDPGSGWSCLAGSTANGTLRRLATICAGDTDPFDAFDPCLEYAFQASDYFADLGIHVVDCNSVSIEDTSWGALKVQYR